MSKKVDIFAPFFQEWREQRKAANESEKAEVPLSTSGTVKKLIATSSTSTTNIQQVDLTSEASGSSSGQGSSASNGTNGYIHYPVHEKGQTLTFENVRIDFPLKPYAAQVQMMRNIVHTINNSENALLESPTGSGKSLALLCAALAWRENEQRKIAAEQAEDKNSAGSSIKMEGVKIEKNSTTSKGKDPVQDTPSRSQQPTVIEIPDDLQPIKTPEKRKLKVTDENRPENWAKKFRCDDGDSVMLADEDSSEDFQTPLKPVKPKMNKVHDENIPTSPPQTSSTAKLTENNNTAKSETHRKVPRIFVGSRTHKQITQLISELKKKTRYNPRITILASREQLCIHPKVSKSSNKTEDCVKLMDKSACSYSQKTHAVITHPSLKNKNRVWDIEDMVKLGKKVKGCPYYASRKLYEQAEVIFCPYNYILDPVIRKILDIQLKDSIVILDEAHNIEDSSRSAGSFEIDEKTLYIVKKELEVIIRNGFESDAHAKIELLVDSLYNWMIAEDNVFAVKEYESQYCHWTGERILRKLNDACITAINFNEELKPAYKTASAHADQVRKETERQALGEEPEGDMTSTQVQIHQRKCLSNNSLTIIQGIFLVLGFLFQDGKNYADDYQMVLTKRIERSDGGSGRSKGKSKRSKNQMESEWSFKLAFKCMNPGIIFHDMSETTRSVILTSGTLSPLNTFAGELETKFERRLEANHVIDKSQVWVGGVMKGPSGVSLKGVFNNVESFNYQDDIGQALCDVIETVPHGVLCFMSSYNTLDKLMERWKVTGQYNKLAARKLIFTEPRGGDKNDFESVIDKFYKQIDKVRFYPDEEGRDGALFFAVFRGKVSEGIDFTDEYCRAVVTVGIPFPSIKDMDVKFKKEYNDLKRSGNRNAGVLSSNEWYSAQAFRAINQALGRCIRHKNDWGAIVLLENRFAEEKNVQSLSKWVRNQYRSHDNYPFAISDLKEFVGRQLARTAAESATSTSSLDTTSTTTAHPSTTNASPSPPQIHNQDKTTTPQIASHTAKTSPSYTAPLSSASSVPLDSIDSIAKHLSYSAHLASTKSLANPPSFSTNTSTSQSTSSATTTTKSIPIRPGPNAPDFGQNKYSAPSNSAKEPTAQPSPIHNVHNNHQAAVTKQEDDDFMPPIIPEIKSAYFNKDFSDTKKEAAPAPQFKAPNPISRHPNAQLVNKALPASESINVTRKDLYQVGPAAGDSSPVCVSCSSCGKKLLERCPKNKLCPAEINDLTLITKNADIDKTRIVEVLAPSRWKTSTSLQGGPINISEWPVETEVTLNSEDGVCYRFLYCECNIFEPVGVILRQCFKEKHAHYQGCVFIWLDRLHIEKIITKSTTTATSTTTTATGRITTTTPADFSVYEADIGSSQIPSMNDYFYSL